MSRVTKRLGRLGVWFAVGRNDPVGSCADAARRRVRLGHVGVELWNELKSFFGEFTDGEGRVRRFMAHCRGDRELDWELLAGALGVTTTPRRCASEELGALGISYGLVNPFESWVDAPQWPRQGGTLQVFDNELLTPIGAVRTVTTNAGDFTWGVEFDIAAFIAAVCPPGIIAPITTRTFSDRIAFPGTRRRFHLGLLTGNAPESGIALWNVLNRTIRERMGDDCTGDISLPEITVRSLPFLGLTMELERREHEVWFRLEGELQHLTTIGITHLVIACNTTHYFTPRIRSVLEPHGIRFLSMAESLATWLRFQKIHRICLVGIGAVADLGRLSPYREPLRDFQVEAVDHRGLARVEQLAHDVKQDGPSEGALIKLRNILRDVTLTTHVVLALTELSLLLEFQRRRPRGGQILIDPLEIYGESIACEYLGLEFPDGIAP